MKKFLTIKAPAKVNLYLKVIGKREDGYHDLSSLMQMVGLYDLLTFEASDSGIRLRIKGGLLPTGRSNLIVRAAQLLQRESRSSKGVSITLTKNIPISAGLGGGSSDAAATLVALNRLWSLRWSREKLARIGATLGSDVPFFFQGPTAWAWGRGDQVERSEATPDGWLVLANPGRPVSTAWVYRQFSKTLKSKESGKIKLTKKAPDITINRFYGLRPSLDEIFHRPHNDLEKVTFKAFPELIRVKRELRRLGGRGTLMSGSGPTLFSFFETREAAKRAVLAMGKNDSIQLWMAKALKRSPF